jgi:hypothetical protein
MNGPMYPIERRKRVPRGARTLRDRRWAKRPAPEVMVAVVQDAADVRSATVEVRSVILTGGNGGNEGAEKKAPGKPFQPKPKE